MSQSGLISLKR